MIWTPTGWKLSRLRLSAMMMMVTPYRVKAEWATPFSIVILATPFCILKWWSLPLWSGSWVGDARLQWYEWPNSYGAYGELMLHVWKITNPYGVQVEWCGLRPSKYEWMDGYDDPYWMSTPESKHLLTFSFLMMITDDMEGGFHLPHIMIWCTSFSSRPLICI